MMTGSRISTINHTVQLTNEWIRELTERLDWADEQRAYRLLRVTLQALRDWLSVDEAAHFAAQLPLLLRGVYYEGWHPAGTPVSDHGYDDFVSRIEGAFYTDPIDDTAAALRKVFETLNNHVTAGEIEDVRHRLPKHLRDLWPEPAMAPGAQV